MAKRTRITRPYPTHSFQDALPIAETIQRVNGGQPVQTEPLAQALGTSTKSSAFIQKLNASSKYGLTVGSYSDEYIELTELGESVTAPGSAEEREDSILESVTKPEVFREFYRIYSGKRMPEDIYASNTLTRELGVPRELTEECLGIIRRNGLVAGIVSDQRGVLMVGGTFVSDSEATARYRANGAPEGADWERDREEEDSGGEDGGRSSDTGSELLIISEADDPALGEVVGLVESLSAPWRSASLGASEGRIISQDLSDALGSARGCVFVWPRDDGAGASSERTPEAKTWAALGAASYRLGERLVILDWESAIGNSQFGYDDSLSGLTGATVVRAAEGESVYPKLMAALVRSGIVRVVV